MPLNPPTTKRSRRSFLTSATSASLGLAAAAGTALLPSGPAEAAPQAPAPPSPETAPPTVTLHPAALRQPIYGFGGSQTYNGDALADFAGRELVYEALFGELKLDILRLRNYDDYPGQQAAFEARTREFARAARRWNAPGKRGVKGPVRLMFTSWSPPPRLKSNNRVSGRSDGTEKGLENGTLAKGPDGKYVYDGFADWWVGSLRKFRDLSGALPDYIALQNELDFAAPYEGMRLLPTEGIGRGGFAFAGYDKALAAVSDKIKAAFGKEAPKIVGPETFTIQIRPQDNKNQPQAYVDPATDAGREALSRLFGISYHLYGVGAESPKQDQFHADLASVARAYHGAAASPSSVPLFETEFLEGDTLTKLADMISDTLVIGEASAYLTWILARDVHKPGYAMVYYRPEDGTIERRERFYAVKHFSAFVGEGWNRIDAEAAGGANAADPDLKVAAFVGPKRDEMVAVLINPTDKEKRVTLAQDADVFRAARTEVFRSSEGEGGERWQNLGALAASGVVSLPKRSVATVRWGGG